MSEQNKEHIIYMLRNVSHLSRYYVDVPQSIVAVDYPGVQ